MYCECGCGERTPIAKVTESRRGQVRGRPLRFIHGHNRRRRAITEADYSIEDRGYGSACWTWRHRLNREGYGRVTRKGKVMLAHVAMYEQELGPVPAERELDHLCRVPACVNPDHLEPVTHAENVRRGLHSGLKRTCANGHPWVPENWASNGPGRKCCLICKRERERRRANRAA
jgi:hypothetical protein